MGENRLNGLALMFVHKDMKLAEKMFCKDLIPRDIEGLDSFICQLLTNPSVVYCFYPVKSIKHINMTAIALGSAYQ